MAVKVRLARFGCRNRPFYRVIATDSRSRRDGKQLEVLGYYNPLPGKDSVKQISLKSDRVKCSLCKFASPCTLVLVTLKRDYPCFLVDNFYICACVEHKAQMTGYWLSVGAQPSEPVQRLLFRAGLLPPPPMVITEQKGGLRDTFDPMTGHFLAQDK